MTARWQTTRGPAALRLLVEFAAEEQGLPAVRCLAGTGLDVAELDDPGAVVHGAQELRATRNLLAHSGDVPGLGVRLGRRFTLSTLSDIGFALLASGSLRAAFELGLRYLPLSGAFVDLTLEQRGGAAWVVIDDRAIPPDVREFLVERDLAVLAVAVDAIRQAGPLELQLAFEQRRAQAIVAALGDLLDDAPIVFAARRTALCIPAGMLERPLAQRDAHAVRRLEERLQGELERYRTAVGIVERARAELLGRPGALATEAEIAAALNLSPRTLRRRLTAAGTPYQQLAHETRSMIACELLRAGVTIADVATQLGYAEPASFTRAFRRWTGTTPGAWRSDQQQQGGNGPRG